MGEETDDVDSLQPRRFSLYWRTLNKMERRSFEKARTELVEND